MSSRHDINNKLGQRITLYVCAPIAGPLKARGYAGETRKKERVSESEQAENGAGEERKRTIVQI